MSKKDTTSSMADKNTGTQSTVPTYNSSRVAIFLKKDLQALVAANFLVPRLTLHRQCTVLMLICDFVMKRERQCARFRAHIALERDIFYEGVEPCYEVIDIHSNRLLLICPMFFPNFQNLLF